MSTKPSKRLPFARTCDALGVTFNFEKADRGVIEIMNKESRLAALEKLADEWEGGRPCTHAEAMPIRGLVNFAEGQIYSRAASLLLPLLLERARNECASSASSPRMAVELRSFVQFLKMAVPRRVTAKDTRAPLCILTDAELNPARRTAGVGAVMLGGNAVPTKFFGEKVPGSTIDHICSMADSDHIISALELLAVGLALKLWGPECMHRRIFIAVDNEAARAAMLNAGSAAPAMRHIIKTIVMNDAKVPMFRWVIRVPSASNWADGPSRLDFASLSKVKAERVRLGEKSFEDFAVGD